MIQFQCPRCGKSYSVIESRIGQRLTCSCGQFLKVPKRSGGRAGYRTWGDIGIEFVVYGGGGALLGFLLGVLIVAPFGFGIRRFWGVILAVTLAGFLIGGLGGERGITWIGKKIRERERP
jgi:hypothetical protein